ncbi:MAG: hypothetical protein WC384_18750 [Prolixibacteraceae bacterium]|jgi:hypothetical protein
MLCFLSLHAISQQKYEIGVSFMSGKMAGIGLKYDFKSGLTISANPCARLHSLIAFSNDGIHYRLLESGIKFGIGYKF